MKISSIYNKNNNTEYPIINMVEKKNKKDVVAEALSEMESIKNQIKAESKNTISTLLKEEVKNVLRESIDDEDEYEVQDPEQEGGEENIDNTDSAEVTDDNSDSDVPADDTTDNGEEPEVSGEVEGGEEVSDDENADEWSEFDKFKVDDDTYDLTGEEDYDTVVKVYKLLKNDDNVVVKKDGDKVTLKDNENDAEYVIDLGGDDEEPAQEEGSEELEQECKLKESKASKNFKKSKTMKENKEFVFEVDLGYTDNYQSKDPIQGLSNNEPSKNKTLDAGVPTGTKKPWAGNAKSQGDPYGEKTIDEQEEGVEGAPESNDAFDNVTNAPDAPVDENVTLPDERKVNKVIKPQPKLTPSTKHVVSQNGEYKGTMDENVLAKNKALMESLIEKTEAVIAENKALKNTVAQVRASLQEALVLNVNLGKVAKLFMENTTSHSEKVDILNRFNEAKTIEQSNMLYETISRELKANNSKNITLESKSLSANDSKAINETKVYESDDLKGIKKMMKRMMNC